MKRKMILIGMLILLICSITTIVKASGEKITFTSDKQELKSKDTFTITVHAESTDGLNLISANFEYDETMLELVERGSMPTGFADWSGPDAKEVVVMASSSPKTEATFTLKFKVKDNVPTNSTATIKFTDVGMDTFAEVNHKFTLEDSEVKLKINTQTAVNPEPTDPEPTDPTPTDPTPTDPTPTEKPDNSTAKDNIPQTGESIVIISIVTVLIGIAIGSWIAYRKYKDVY